MAFSSIVFIWFFLPIVFGGNVLVQRVGGNRISNIFLLLASLFFYAWGEPVYIVLMLISICLNWALGNIISNRIKYRKCILLIAVTLNMAILAFFKYFGMVISTVNLVFKTSFSEPPIGLPIGISFFTFQALSYVIDVYRNECVPQRSIIKLALYISFFPQLIAGPIVKYKDIAEQIDNRRMSIEKIPIGIRRFVYGFAKKILISNVLASCVDNIYALERADITSILAWTASILYTFQIYYDFSGYSDMAIGLGKIFGFDIKENFNYPYISLSIREFWRRWHISLGSWFREYVYFPLGGSRSGEKKTYRNLMIIFFLTGLWHGAGYSFIFWGLFHGLFITIERIGLEKYLAKHKIIAWVYTFFVVNFAWIFFRLESIRGTFALIKKMIFPWHYISGTYSLWNFVDHRVIFVLLCAIMGMGFIQKVTVFNKVITKFKYSFADMFFCAVLMILSLINLASNAYNPFIYFRF